MDIYAIMYSSEYGAYEPVLLFADKADAEKVAAAMNKAEKSDRYVVENEKILFSANEALITHPKLVLE